MGFKLSINNILRSEVAGELRVGQEYAFSKELSVLADDIQIWLTKRDWTAVAEIQITSQTRSNGRTVGQFVVKHVYTPEESAVLTAVFRRMYGWDVSN